jgi:outer membrane lipoprotein carrier protein
MKRILSVSAVLLCSLAFSGAAHAQNARAQLDRFSDGLETLHATFEQQVIGSDGEATDRSSGEVWLSRPHLFRWEYGGEFPELVVADGRNIWIYDEQLEQVTVKDQGQAVVDSPLTLLTDPGRLDRQFEVTEAGESDQWQLLELRPKDSNADFERILLGLRDDSLQLMVMEDTFGLRTEITFGAVQRNPKLDSGLFKFEPPESADVIGEIQR